MTSHLFLTCFMAAFMALTICGYAAKAGARVVACIIAGCSWAALSLFPMLLIGHALPARLPPQRISAADIGVLMAFLPLVILASKVPLLMVPQRWRG